jgi:hypothetical protein
MGDLIGRRDSSMRRPSWSRRSGHVIAITSVILFLNTCGGGEVFGTTFYTAPSSGNGIHNPRLLRALPQASIEAMLATYFSRSSAVNRGTR